MASDKTPRVLLNTQGACLFCFKKVERKETLNIDHLSKYLRVEMEKLIGEVDLDVVLCKDCDLLNRKFSELYKELGKIRVQIVSCLIEINCKMSRVELIEEGDAEGSGDGHRPCVAKRVRDEMILKCSQKLDDMIPKVKINRVVGELEYSDPRSPVTVEEADFDNEEETVDVNNEVKSEVEDYILPDEPYSTNDSEDEKQDDAKYEDSDSDYNPASPDLESPPTSPESSSSFIETNSLPRPRSSKINPKSGGSKQLECDLCKRPFLTPGAMRHHRSRCNPHHFNPELGERCHTCDICGKSFKFRRILREHIHRVHQVKKYQCSHCSRRFAMPYMLKNHLKTHRDPSVPAEKKKIAKTKESETPREVPRPCEVCGKVLKTIAIYRLHIREVHGDSKFICDTCGSVYPSRRSLLQHKRHAHIDPEKFPCPDCGKGFPTRPRLREHHEHVHLKMKRPKRRYRCDICNELFHSLPQHRPNCVLRFTKYSEQPSTIPKADKYICPEVDCGKTFHAPSRLKLHHEKEHLGLRFKCVEPCDKSYKVKRVWRKHQEQCEIYKAASEKGEVAK